VPSAAMRCKAMQGDGRAAGCRGQEPEESVALEAGRRRDDQLVNLSGAHWHTFPMPKSGGRLTAVAGMRRWLC
jgi:hypothetical protein